MFDFVILTSVFVFLMLGAYYDFKTKELPYFLTLPFISLMLFFQLYRTVLLGISGTMWLILSVTIVFGLNFFFYKVGIRGGGDALAVLGLALAFGNNFYGFIVVYLLLEAVGAFYGMFYTLGSLFKNRNKIKISKDIKFLFSLLLILTFILLLVEWVLSFLFFLVGLLFIFIVTLSKYEKQIFVRRIKVDDLVGEEWILKDISKGKYKVTKKKTGLTDKDIKTLKKMKLKSIEIREGIPLIPGYFLGYILFILAWFFFRSKVIYFTNMLVFLV